jgi:hypothetical protein
MDSTALSDRRNRAITSTFHSSGDSLKPTFATAASVASPDTA